MPLWEGESRGKQTIILSQRLKSRVGLTRAGIKEMTMLFLFIYGFMPSLGAVGRSKAAVAAFWQVGRQLERVSFRLNSKCPPLDLDGLPFALFEDAPC